MKSTPAVIAALGALCALALFAPRAAFAAEEPEAVYAKFHRAVAARNLEEMLRYGPRARRDELASMSAAQKDATLKMAASMMPRAFTLRSKLVNPGGRSARLVLSGTGENLLDGRPETLYGEIAMVMEGGEWKVDESSWSNEQPPNVAPAAGAAGSRAGAPPASAAAKPPSAPVAKPAAITPLRTLGAAKPPCVYKAVMTAEDVENCK
jgi:hypothetical protein